MDRLPDSQFEVMCVLWDHMPPVTTGVVMEELGRSRGWKLQTAITLLNRLEERGFVRSEKNGRERLFFPLVPKAEYLELETGHFLKQYHGNSIHSFISALGGGATLSPTERQELSKWLEEQEEQI